MQVIESFPWRNPRWHPLKLEASSPFRAGDDSPSFSVNLDPSSDKYGWWNDWGAKEKRWRAGPPEKLIAFLRDITEEEALELIHGGGRDGPGEYILTIRLPQDSARKRYKPIDPTLYNSQPSEYLSGRGITTEIQALLGTGYNPRYQAVTFPWKDPSGIAMNVKYRSTRDKIFWYARGGAPVRTMIYGIDVIYAQRIKRVLIVESETDALYAWSCGVPAVAVGGSAFTEDKANLLRRSPVEELLLGADNDTAGQALREQITQKMRGYCALYDVEIPPYAKDMNDVKEAETVRKICEEARLVGPIIAL
ncbi:toprim domain-containing protein [Paenibacillus dakarensis]|uniref:toprim domain-containing protein n=1 Tax=Paenibacillus dakarensis TaxID=1527293 RepID=UPI0006D577D0|nr:toprim domain-containing protein [Paenibacillus dakarensis]